MKRVRVQNAESRVPNAGHETRSEELDGRDLEMLRQMPGPAVPEGLAAGISRAVRERGQGAETGNWKSEAAWRRGVGLRRALVSMAAVVLVVFGLWLGTRLGDNIFGGQSQRYAELLAGPGQSSGEGR